MGCVQGKEKEKENFDQVIRLYESKLTGLNAEIVKLEREKTMFTDRCTLLQANEKVDSLVKEPVDDENVEQTKF